MAEPVLSDPGYHPGTTLIIITAIFGFFSVTTTALRVGIKARQRQLYWEELTIAVSMILLLVQTVFNGLQYHGGSGRHANTLTQAQFQRVLKYVYITEILLFLVLCFTKISICLFVLRIKNTKPLRRSLNALMVGLVATTIICEVVLFAQCQPFRAFWDQSAGTCWDLKIYFAVIWVQVGRSSTKLC